MPERIENGRLGELFYTRSAPARKTSPGTAANDPNPLYLLLKTQTCQPGQVQSAKQAIVQRMGKLPYGQGTRTTV
jgi:hypothetical protein